MERELLSLTTEKVWTLVKLPKDQNSIPVRWTNNLKVDSTANVLRFKARHVGEGFMQVEAVEYSEIFWPVSKCSTVKLNLALTAFKGWNSMCLRRKAACLKATFDQDLFADQRESILIPGHEEKIYLLLKALYGLRQASRL